MRLTQDEYLPPSKVLAVGLGNALEFYDFGAYSYFAIQIGHTFFPEAHSSHGLLFSLATFAVGFITRPLGALLIGRHGDRVGRRAAMLWSFGLMGLAILGMALIPSYGRIGRAAPILLVVFRLLQGLAVGGEVGPSTAFLVEAAPPHRRGLYVALQLATQYLAGIAAGVVGFVLSDSLSPAQLDAWGWRVALLIGVAVVPVGLYIRRGLPETLRQPSPATVGHKAERVPARLLVAGLLMTAAGTTSVYVIGYMNTYVQDTLALSARFGFAAAIVEGLTVMCVAPLGGAISDRVGRRPVMLTSFGLLLILVVPCYVAMTAWRSPAAVYAVTAVLAALEALAIVPTMTLVSESMPQAVRSTAFGMVYAIGVAVFGGFTQFIIKSLMVLTGNPLAPAWYMAFMIVVGGSAMLAIRESAPCRQRAISVPAPR
jgi:MFS transporter, MHS family, citrate/tricarballylate:H+ symporter